MKSTEDVCNDLGCLAELTRIIAMSESKGMSYTHEEVSASFRSIWQQLEHIHEDLDEIVSNKQ